VAAVSVTDDYCVYLADFPRSGRNGVDSSSTAEVIYVSGSDPRFETLPVCTNGEPASGQVVRDGDAVGDGVTTSGTVSPEQPVPFSYVPGTLRVEVNGRNWTGVTTETDPDAGEYDLAYPPPLGSTIRVIYTRA
jgi:hypothetical protein